MQVDRRFKWAATVVLVLAGLHIPTSWAQTTTLRPPVSNFGSTGRLGTANAPASSPGDSPNDQPMFAYFPHSVGVANVKNFLDMLSAEPAYVTDAACGAGFVELANAILLSR